jgi:hypothetical protein
MLQELHASLISLTALQVQLMGKSTKNRPNPATALPHPAAPHRNPAAPALRFAPCALRLLPCALRLAPSAFCLAPSDCACPSKPHWEWMPRITQSCNPSGTALACPTPDARSPPESNPPALAYTNPCCGSLPGVTTFEPPGSCRDGC